MAIDSYNQKGSSDDISRKTNKTINGTYQINTQQNCLLVICYIKVVKIFKHETDSTVCHEQKNVHFELSYA